jgi:hypothetical protein
MAISRGVLCVCALLWPALASPASRALPSSIVRLRPLTSLATEFVARGLDGSPTFRSLVERIERSDVIVYVDLVRRTPGAPDGATRLLNASRYFRFLLVSINQDLAPADIVAMLGHELQHAVEIADRPGIRDAVTLARYYRDEGIFELREGCVCSEAARDAARRVRVELASAAPGRGGDVRFEGGA